MNIPTWIKWAIAALALLAIVPIIGIVALGGNQVRCVGVDEAGKVVKAMGKKCDRLDQVVYTELGPDGQIHPSPRPIPKQ